MKNVVAPHIENLKPYVPGKPAEELAREQGIDNAIKLASNENPLGPSSKVFDSITAALPRIYRYPDSDSHHLRKALAGFHGVQMEQVFIGNGSNEIIDLLYRTFTTPDDHVVYGSPSFVCYPLGAKLAQTKATEVPLRYHLFWDLIAIEYAIQSNTKFLFLANPNNPTGSYVGKEPLIELLQKIPEDVIVVMDEAYFEYVSAPDYVSAIELREHRKNLVVLRTFSKAYGLAALRVGYAILPPHFYSYLNRVRAPFNVNEIAQVAACAALEDQAHLQKVVDFNSRERKRVSQALASLDLHVAPSEANFVLVDLGNASTEAYNFFLSKGVIVRPMPSPINTWVRITIGLVEENNRMIQVLKDWLEIGNN